MKIIKESWNPSYEKYNSKLRGFEIIYYDKAWYCQENKIIHGNEKEKDNCKYCKDR